MWEGTSVADPDPVPFSPGSGMGKKSGSGSGIWIRVNNLDHISDSLKAIFFGLIILKFFDGDPGSGTEKFGSG
jgi:hypothetical protein